MGGGEGNTKERCCMLINEGKVCMVFRHSWQHLKEKKVCCGLGEEYECQGVSERVGSLP